MKQLISVLTLIVSTLTITLFSCNKDDDNDSTKTEVISGCMDPNSFNYNANATIDDGSCVDYQGSSKDTTTQTIGATAVLLQEDLMIYTFISNSSENGDTDKSNDTIAVPNCAIVTLNSQGPLKWPKILTIDFGTSGTCEGFDGKKRKGQIVATFNGNWKLHSGGDSITVELINYSVNDTSITGKRTYWLNNFSLINGQLELGMKTENASIIYPDLTSASWNITGTYNLTGLNTPKLFTDDMVSINVTGSGTNVKGNMYSISTPTPLVSSLSCIQNCPFVEGITEIETSLSQDTTILNVTYNVITTTHFSLNFGDGTCNNNVDLTTNINANASDGSNTINLFSTTTGPKTISCSSIFTLED